MSIHDFAVISRRLESYRYHKNALAALETIPTTSKHLTRARILATLLSQHVSVFIVQLFVVVEYLVDVSLSLTRLSTGPVGTLARLGLGQCGKNDVALHAGTTRQ
jgi:hypothetical protein